jgi:capsule polysaccharide modification protein KpsS
LNENQNWEMILNRYELDTILKTGIKKGMAGLKRRMNGVVSQAVSLDRAESRNAIHKNNYILFTLQNYTEERVLGHAFPYFDQAWLIEYLSKIAPTDHELYVKDHPGAFGLQPPSSINSISKHAKLLHKEFPSYKAIKQASAVVTINNTVGFESLLYGKDVICMGNAFYSGAGYTRDVKNLNELPRVLHQATSSEGLTNQEIVEFVNGLLSGSYQGEFTANGIRDFTDSILRYINDNELIEN